MEERLFDRITFCLVRPENPGNIGSAARALNNMGFSRLALVSPSDPRGEEAIRMAYRSHDILNSASLHSDLGSALAEAEWVVGLSGRDSAATGSFEEAASETWDRAKTGPVVLLFGPEGSGLMKEELARCHRTAFIPTGARFSSLNLAQAVLIAAYTLFRTSGASDRPGPGRSAAPVNETEPFFAELESMLEKSGFLKPPAKKEVVRELRSLFTRAGLDRREVALLRAMVRQMRWAVENKTDKEA